VADTENHLLRAVNLTERVVTTEAGTGEQCMWREEGGRATLTALNSPWDLAAVGPLLFIAMAGPHQIWMLDHARGILWPYAGSGQERASTARLRRRPSRSRRASPSWAT
jgi:hypothetical protein